jgi:PDZ domain
VVRIASGSPLDKAGVRIGDVIEAVDGRPTAGMSDWFVVRANFERDRRTQIQVRRGGQHLRLWFTITTPNRSTWNPAIVASQVARVIVLLLALVVAFSRPGQPSARLAALIFAMIAVAEGYPSAGWAAGLRQLPGVLSIPIALATASWLLMAIVWLSLCAVFPRPLFTRRWQWAVGLAPLAIFAPLLVTSAFALVYAPAALAMPSPFAVSIATKRIGEIMGIVPQLFVNLWPGYQPLREAWLLGLWFVISMAFLLTGFLMMVVNSRRLSDATERRQMQVVIVALDMVWVIGIHNVLVRNWMTFFERTPPPLFSGAGEVAEAIVFPFVALVLAYAVLRQRLPLCTSA